MALTKSIVINFKGGIVSPGYLKEVLLLAKDARVEAVHFGLRQQLIMDIPVSRMDAFAKRCKEKSIFIGGSTVDNWRYCARGPHRRSHRLLG